MVDRVGGLSAYAWIGHHRSPGDSRYLACQGALSSALATRIPGSATEHYRPPPGDAGRAAPPRNRAPGCVQGRPSEATQPVPIPPSSRVQYANNTLEEVLCQLRFPPILKIGSPAPAGFQERLRDQYPLFREQSEASIILPPGSSIPIDLARLVPTATAYEFASADEVWKLSLARDFIALTCSKYDRWENFR